MSTAKPHTAYVQPQGVIEVEAPSIEVDLGHETKLLVMLSHSGGMHFALKDYSKGMDKPQLFHYVSYTTVTATWGNPYDNRSWVYFFSGSLLVISVGYKHVTLQMPITKESLKPGITGIDKDTFDSLLIEKLRLQKPQQKPTDSGDSLNQVRLNTDASDFTIICKDDISIPVHTAILSTFWPFFQNMMSNDCKEKTERTLHLDFPSNWVSPMVSHIYQQPVQLTLEEATGVLILAEMYLLPDLEVEAVNLIKRLVSEETTIEDLILGWTHSREANNDTMRQFFAQKISKKSPMSHSELFKGWEETKLLELYFDTVQVMY